MPFNQVMPKFQAGNLHSGSKNGPKVTNPKQAVAIMYSEKRESKNKKEYRPKKDGLSKTMSHIGSHGY
jgi:hypothetical protein